MDPTIQPPDDILRLFDALDPPFPSFAADVLGPEFAAELRTTSELWFRCGYRPGIAAYLAFFLLRDFLVLHDRQQPARFGTGKAMAKSFYETDLFIRAVTDSGREPSGGISSPAVRGLLAEIAARHQVLAIPTWMMTWFGWTLFEAVENQCAPLSAEQQRLHLGYMARTYRLMGIPFAADRDRMVAFARVVERAHAGASPQLEQRAHDILCIGEAIGVSSDPTTLEPLLPSAVRPQFRAIAAQVRPGLLRRGFLRVLGALTVPKAVGAARVAVPHPV